jgi:biopolymer transport protein TolQ
METAYAQTTAAGMNTNAFQAITQAGPIVQLTLLTLILMSITCWAIIFQKRKRFKAIEEDNSKFLEAFWRASSLDHLNQEISKYENSPVAQVFKSGFQELQRIAESNMVGKNNSGTAPRLHGIDNLVRSLQKASDLEIMSMEKHLTFLATTGSTGPFIGLFGTVWGIMSAFHKIGQTGAASLAVVAPGISEALVATAIGLAAAIPATVAYNNYIARLKREELEIEGFKTDFLNIAKRNFFKDE